MQGRRPSRTALEVAQNFAYVGHDPVRARLLPPGAAETTERLLVACGLLSATMRRLFTRAWFHRLGDGIADLFLGISSWHVLLRKRFFEDEVRAALASGTRQLLSIGAGFDTLCLRLAMERPDVTCVEIDHPSTQALKRLGMQRMGATRPNLHLVAADVAQVSIRQTIDEIGEWNPTLPSVLVAEAVFMYLPRAAVSDVLANMHGVSGPGSVLLFTWSRGDASGRPDAGRLTRPGMALLRLVGEPVLWSPDASALASVLSDHGFELVRDPIRFDLYARYLDPAGLGDGWHTRLPEMMGLATRRVAATPRAGAVV